MARELPLILCYKQQRWWPTWANNRSKAENLLPHPLEHLALIELKEEEQGPMSQVHVAPFDPTRPLKMPIKSMEMKMMPHVERPNVTHTQALVPQISSSKLVVMVHRPLGPTVLHPFQKPVKFNDVYLDDLLFGMQGNWDEHVRHLWWLLYSIDDVFHPLSEQVSSYCKHVPSKSSLAG